MSAFWKLILLWNCWGKCFIYFLFILVCLDVRSYLLNKTHGKRFRYDVGCILKSNVIAFIAMWNTHKFISLSLSLKLLLYCFYSTILDVLLLFPPPMIHSVKFPAPDRLEFLYLTQIRGFLCEICKIYTVWWNQTHPCCWCKMMVTLAKFVFPFLSSLGNKMATIQNSALENYYQKINHLFLLYK